MQPVEIKVGAVVTADEVPAGAVVTLGCGCTHRKVWMPIEQIARSLQSGQTYAQAQNGMNYPWFKLVRGKCGQENCQFVGAKRGRSGWCFDKEVVIVKMPSDREIANAKWHEEREALDAAERVVLPGDDLLTKLAKAAQREQDLEVEVEGYRREVKDLIKAGKMDPKEVLAGKHQFPKRVLWHLFDAEREMDAIFQKNAQDAADGKFDPPAATAPSPESETP